MSQVENPPSAPPAPATPPTPQVVYLQPRQGRFSQLLMFVLIVAVLVLLGLQLWPHIKLPAVGEDKQLSREDLVNQLEPEMLLTPTGRKLEVVDIGGKLFEITRVIFDGNDQRRCLVSITVPGKPPQQNIFRPGDSFERGRILIKEVGDGFVVLKCDGEQRTFGVQGLMPDDSGARSPAASGTTIMPPKDMAGAVPAAPGGGRVKAPEHPMADDKTSENPEEVEAEGDVKEGVPLNELPDERHFAMAREDFRSFVEALPGMFAATIVLQVIRDPETQRSWGLQVKRIDAYSKLSSFGMRSGDVIVAIGEQQIRSHADVDMAMKQTFRDFIDIEVVRGDESIYFVIEAGAESPARKD